MDKQNKRFSGLVLVLFLLTVLLVTGCQASNEEKIYTKEITIEEQSQPQSEAEVTKELSSEDKKILEKGEEFIVQRVVDGDTFETSDGTKVRMIGVDTPESVKPNHPVEPYGKEASNFTKKILEGQKVYLTYDVEPTDQYGRSLAYAFLEDGTFYNELLVKEGYAQVMTIPPNVEYQDVFLAAQQYARENNKGLWGLAETNNELSKVWVDDNGNGLIKGSRSKIYHLPGGYFYDKTTNVVEWFKTEEEAIEAGYRKSKK